jgi:hypothetical protein
MASFTKGLAKTPLNGVLPLPDVIRTQLFNDSAISKIFAPSLIRSGAIVCFALRILVLDQLTWVGY